MKADSPDASLVSAWVAYRSADCAGRTDSWHFSKLYRPSLMNSKLCIWWFFSTQQHERFSETGELENGYFKTSFLGPKRENDKCSTILRVLTVRKTRIQAKPLLRARACAWVRASCVREGMTEEPSAAVVEWNDRNKKRGYIGREKIKRRGRRKKR